MKEEIAINFSKDDSCHLIIPIVSKKLMAREKLFSLETLNHTHTHTINDICIAKFLFLKMGPGGGDGYLSARLLMILTQTNAGAGAINSPLKKRTQ